MPQNTEMTVRQTIDMLWHLGSKGANVYTDAIRALSDVSEVLSETSEPECEGQRTRVVLIDNAVDPDHPLLKGAINKSLSLDFTTHRLGVFYNDDLQGRRGKVHIPKQPTLTQSVEEFARRMGNPNGAPTSPTDGNGIEPAIGAKFSAHGTSCAGLIGARPAQMADLVSTFRKQENASAYPLQHEGVPYMGADPTCEIVSIATNFDVDGEQMLFAFSYALWIGADIIVLPRHIPIPSEVPFPEQLRATTDQAPIWSELDSLLRAIEVPVFCAAGNTPDIIYPAKLSRAVSEDEGNPYIFAIGARTYGGKVASYSPRKVDLFAPSGDGEIYDGQDRILDRNDPEFDKAAFCGLETTADTRAFDRVDVYTIDIPGPFGYNPGPEPFSYVDPRTQKRQVELDSLFTPFSGTSAAVSIAAGVASLLVRQDKALISNPVNLRNALRASMAQPSDEKPHEGTPPKG